MHRIISILFVLTLFSLNFSSPVYAMDSIDFGAITCSEFINEMSQVSDEDAGTIMMWLDGYLSGITGDTVLRFSGLEEIGEALVNGCAESPNSKVLDVVRIVGIRR